LCAILSMSPLGNRVTKWLAFRPLRSFAGFFETEFAAFFQENY